jgi:Fe-S-cluster containining protein
MVATFTPTPVTTNKLRRECGTCTLCCTTSAIPETRKPSGITCEHCAIGCSIYNSRPQSCRAFECAWLKGEMGEDQRPDKIGVVVEHLPGTKRTVIALTLVKDDEIPVELISYYNDSGRAVLARGGRAFLPESVSHEAAMDDMMNAARAVGVG